MYYRARYYDPATGEFISQDPLEYADGMSQYRAYFTPNGVDPLGLADEKVYVPKLRIDRSSYTQLARFGNKPGELILSGGKQAEGSGKAFAFPWEWKASVYVSASDTSILVRPTSKYRWHTRTAGGHGNKWDYLISSEVNGKVWCKCVDGKPQAFASVTPSDAQVDSVVATNASLAKTSQADGSITIQFVAGGSYRFLGAMGISVRVKGVSLSFGTATDSFSASGSLLYECVEKVEPLTIPSNR